MKKLLVLLLFSMLFNCSPSFAQVGPDNTVLNTISTNTGVLTAANVTNATVYTTATAVNSTTTIYTVPTGKTLYLTSFSNNETCTSAVTCELILMTGGGITATVISETQCASGSDSDSRTMVYPIVLAASDQLNEYSSTGGGLCTGGFTGWLQ